MPRDLAFSLSDLGKGGSATIVLPENYIRA
jgi:hypothetical protein